jgi:hypothetical protein
VFVRGKLLRESEWSRVYEAQVGSRPATLHESKFLTDGMQPTADSIISRWGGLSFPERLDFANAFAAKPEVTTEDERILDFLMETGDFYICMAVAPLLTRHRDRGKALGFLLERIGENRKDRANLFQAVREIKDKRAVPALRAAYENYREALGKGARSGDQVDYMDYLECCAALWAIEASAEYKEAIEEALTSKDPTARRLAESLLCAK